MVLSDLLERETLGLMTLDYEVEEYGHVVPEPVLTLYCRDTSGNRRTIEVEGFYPFFYISEEDYVRLETQLLSDHRIRYVEARKEIVSTEAQYNNAVHEMDEAVRKTLHDEPLVRIFTVVPKHVKELKEDGIFEQTWEADVFFTNRFLISADVYDGLTIPLGKDRVHFDEIEPASVTEIKPRMVGIDIEVWTGGVFPDVTVASKPITAVTAYDSYDEEYIGGVLRPSLDGREPWDDHGWPVLDPDWTLPDGVEWENVEIRVFEDEAQMLGWVNNWIVDKDPDLLTGWNSSNNDIGFGFDYPYWINRCQQVSEWTYRDLSPLGQCYVTKRGNAFCRGREMFDMLQAYKKTQIHEKRSYALGAIAEEELGYGKEDVVDLDDGWLYEPVEFMQYNIRDTQATMEIEQARGVIDMYDHIRSITGVTYAECAASNIGIIDLIYLRQASKRKIALPTSTKPERGWYYGAKVYTPVPGKHTNVVYPDLKSLYPFLMWSLNLSPETIYMSEEELKADGYSLDDCYRGYIDMRPDYKKRRGEPELSEIYYLKPEVKEGFVRSVITDLTDMKYEYKSDEYPAEAYEAVKRIVNSVYGVFGDSKTYGTGFRLFDWRLAETITIAGRLVLDYTSDEFLNALHSMGYADAFRVGGDSVPGNEPTLIKRDSVVQILPIEDVVVGDMVWSHDGWTRVNRVIKKPNRKNLYTVATKSGVVHVTEDHSLVRDTMEEIRPEDVEINDELLHNDIASADVSTMDFDEKRAWLLGLFAAEGSCGIYQCESGSKVSWAINNTDTSILEHAQDIMREAYGIQTKIDNVMESSATQKLRLHNNCDNASVVLGFRKMLYDGAEKRVPTEILNANDAAKKAFIAGYHTGDGHISHDSKEFDEMWTKHKHLASGVVLLLRQLGYPVTLSVRTEQSDEYYRIRVVSYHIGSATCVRKIVPYSYDGEYVYDLETANHHFHSGIGSMIVHNTDSVMTSIPSARSMEETIDAAMKAAKHVNGTYDSFMEETFWIDNPDNHKTEVEVESYAEALFFQRDFKKGERDGVKKRYSQLVTWDEGTVIENPTPKTKGFDLVRSDCAMVTAEVQKEVLNLILKEDKASAKKKISKLLRENWNEIIDGEVELEYVGKPARVSKALEDYGWSVKELDDPTVSRDGERLLEGDEAVHFFTPQPHVRGYRYAKSYIDGENPSSGSKGLFFYCSVDPTGAYPETYDYENDYTLNYPRGLPLLNEPGMYELGRPVDAVAVEDVRRLPEEIRINWEKMAEKTLRDPIEDIVRTMGWLFDDMLSESNQSDLSSFM